MWLAWRRREMHKVFWWETQRKKTVCGTKAQSIRLIWNLLPEDLLVSEEC